MPALAPEAAIPPPPGPTAAPGVGVVAQAGAAAAPVAGAPAVAPGETSTSTTVVSTEAPPVEDEAVAPEPLPDLGPAKDLVGIDGWLQADIESLDDLRIPPGNRLEKLSGERRGQHSVHVNEQWRICFRWEDGSAFDVEIADYH